MADDERPNGMLLGRIVIEKYATEDDIIIGVESTDGGGDGLALVDILGMLAFAQHHAWDSIEYDDEAD